jgi:mono/diheme cytochrome c family protein
MKNVALLLLIPVVAALTGCTGEMSLSSEKDQLVSKNVTEAKVVIFPDVSPSIPDGKKVFEKMNCAQCHGADGKAVAGKATKDLSAKEYGAKSLPLEQYQFVVYGGQGVEHPDLKDKLTRRELWDLVIYVRSLAVPPISDEQFAALDPVFGSNCAVCHGKLGFGDGPLAKNLEPIPANFHQFDRFYDRTDDVLWDHIANGIKWEGMPNFLNKTDRVKNVKFDEAYIHNLVKYVRTFHTSNQPSAPMQISAKGGGGSARVHNWR